MLVAALLTSCLRLRRPRRTGCASRRPSPRASTWARAARSLVPYARASTPRWVALGGRSDGFRGVACSLLFVSRLDTCWHALRPGFSKPCVLDRALTLTRGGCRFVWCALPLAHTPPSSSQRLCSSRKCAVLANESDCHAGGAGLLMGAGPSPTPCARPATAHWLIMAVRPAQDMCTGPPAAIVKYEVAARRRRLKVRQNTGRPVTLQTPTRH